MSKTLKILSWNIKHFSGRNTARLTRIIDYLKDHNPDIISLYEIKGSIAYGALKSRLPGYVWMTTSGIQSQEILVGVRKSLGEIAFDQRDGFKGGNNFLRPGLLTTITTGDVETSFLSLHLKSHADYLAIGTRAEQFDAMLKLGRLFKRRGARLVIMGDLNTFGLHLPKPYGFGTKGEFKIMARRFKNAGLRILPKTHDHTWTPSKTSEYKIADLDYFIVNHNVKIKDDAPVLVDWPKGYSPRSDRSKWYRDDMSDHAPIITEIIT